MDAHAGLPEPSLFACKYHFHINRLKLRLTLGFRMYIVCFNIRVGEEIGLFILLSYLPGVEALGGGGVTTDVLVGVIQ